MPAYRIQSHTRHKSTQMVTGYIREADKWTKSGLDGVGFWAAVGSTATDSEHPTSEQASLSVLIDDIKAAIVLPECAEDKSLASCRGRRRNTIEAASEYAHHTSIKRAADYDVRILYDAPMKSDT